MEILFISLLILFLAVFLSLKRPKINSDTDLVSQLQTENEQLKIALAVAQQNLKNAQSEATRITDLIKEERQDLEFKLLGRINKLEQEKQEILDVLNQEKLKNSSISAKLLSEKEKLEEQRHYIDNLQQRFKVEFENIANQILKQKTSEFTEVNKTNLDILLNPLKENIKAFEQKIEQSYKIESAERFTLKGAIDELVKQTKLIQDDANNLTKALKGDNKKQGNWGEMVLDRLLEGSGLIDGVNYFKQGSFKTEEGSRLLPDVILHLPEQKHIVIDSKVSLVAYDRLINAEDDEKEGYLKQHIASIKNHILGLSSKNYHDLYQINSPEFVLLFVPIESSFAIAVQTDRDLFDFAWSRKVVIVTPSTLLATLKTVASIWKQEQQTKNALEIASKAGALYDKFVGFINDMNRIGENIEKSQKAYSDAMNKLSNGTGNLVSRAENIRKLGAKTSKMIDPKYLED